MEYIEIKIKTESEKIEEISGKLIGIGIDSFQINDPDEIERLIENLDDTEWYDKEQISSDFLENKVADGLAEITVYLDDSEEGRIKGKELESLFPSEAISIEQHSDSEWKDNWKEYYVPTRVTSRIVVAPTWASSEDIETAVSADYVGPTEDYEKALWESDKFADIVIQLDPGMAFGTGTHETTSLTLGMMERYIPEMINRAILEQDLAGEVEVEPPELKLLDVGTGSGILAIAAARLGAKDILAIDIDEEAVRAAKENIEENLFLKVSDTLDKNMEDPIYEPNIRVIKGDLTEGVDYKADIVVANLLTDLIIRFAPDAAKHLNPGGLFITSGILIEHEDKVLDAFRDAGFNMDTVSILEKGEWCAISAYL